MGGRVWSEEEERVFWTEIIPSSNKRHLLDRPYASDARGWEALRETMQRRMGRLARRRYTALMLYEHFFQNCVLERFSPNAARFVRGYIDNERLTTGQAPSQRSRSSQRSGRRSRASNRIGPINRSNRSNRLLASFASSSSFTSFSDSSAAVPAHAAANTNHMLASLPETTCQGDGTAWALANQLDLSSSLQDPLSSFPTASYSIFNTTNTYADAGLPFAPAQQVQASDTTRTALVEPDFLTGNGVLSFDAYGSLRGCGFGASAQQCITATQKPSRIPTPLDILASVAPLPTRLAAKDEDEPSMIKEEEGMFVEPWF